jgi:hypothetical protein
VNEIATCTIARTCDRGRRRGQASAPTCRICTQVRSADLPHLYRWGGGGLRGVLYARTSGGGLRFAIFGSELVGRAGSQTATVWPGCLRRITTDAGWALGLRNRRGNAGNIRLVGLLHWLVRFQLG